MLEPTNYETAYSEAIRKQGITACLSGLGVATYNHGSSLTSEPGITQC